MLKNQLIFFFLSTFFLVKGQHYSLYPQLNSTFQQQKVWVNPAYVSEVGNYSLNFQTHFRTVNRGQAGLYFFDGGTWIRKDSVAHGFRLLVANEKEGPYISRPRAYVNYALLRPLTRHWSLYSGVSFGFFSTFISAATTTLNNNFMLPDGNIGFGIKNKRLDGGFSIMQAFDNEIAEVRHLKLRRYYHYHFSYQQPVNNNFVVELSGFYRHFLDLDNQLTTSLEVEYKNQLSMGTLYHTLNGVSFLFNYSDEIYQTRYSLFLTYNLGITAASRKLSQSMEMGVGLNFL